MDNNVKQIAQEKGVDTPLDLFVEANGQTFFAGDDGGEAGLELWASDGTVEGTNLVKDIIPGTGIDEIDGTEFNNTSFPRHLTELNGKVYFSANDNVNGRELWVSDGTSEGTQIVKNIKSLRGSNPQNLTNFNNKIYFTAETADSGEELWVTNGTTSGTMLVADINPGSGNAFNSFFYDYDALSVVGDELLFTANDGTGEQEYRVNLDGSVELVNGIDPNEPNEINGTGNNDVLTGTGNADIIKGFDGRDTLEGGAGDDTLIGNNRQDKLVGGAGNDSLVGGSGDDTLDGGLGNDILTGNGNDSFVLRAGDGSDIITDYVIGSDRLLLADGLTADDLTFSGSDIFAGDEKLATLNNVNASNLRPFNFTEI